MTFEKGKKFEKKEKNNQIGTTKLSNLKYLFPALAIATGSLFLVLKKDKDKPEYFQVSPGTTITAIVKDSLGLTQEQKDDPKLCKILVEEIARENKENIPDPDKLKIGDTIFVDQSALTSLIKRYEKDQKEDGKKKKEKKDKNKISQNHSERPTDKELKERFVSGKKYFLEKYEVMGEKSIVDTYSNLIPQKINKLEHKLNPNIYNIGSAFKYGEVEKIVLHSTATNSITSMEGISKIGAQVFISKEGEIYFLGNTVDNIHYLNKINHAGESLRDCLGLSYFKNKSIGIEVDAKSNEEWNDKQYEAVKSVLFQIAEKYNKSLKVSDVLTHSQIAKSKYGRGRKFDPYYVNREKLGFPNNYTLFDPDVAKGIVDPNLSNIVKEFPPNHAKNMISGLFSSVTVSGKNSRSLENAKNQINKNSK